MASDMFLKIDNNAKIKGESLDRTHKDAIQVLSWSWGMSQSSTASDGPRGGSGGKVNVQDLSLTKFVDKSSPGLMKACCDCTPFGVAQLVVRKAGGSPLDYFVVDMDEVRVSSISTGGSGGEDRLTENVTLNFKVVKVHYQPQGKDGAKDGGLVEMGWNISENAPA